MRLKGRWHSLLVNKSGSRNKNRESTESLGASAPNSTSGLFLLNHKARSGREEATWQSSLSALLTDKSKGHCFLGGVAYISRKGCFEVRSETISGSLVEETPKILLQRSTPQSSKCQRNKKRSLAKKLFLGGGWWTSPLASQGTEELSRKW